MSSRKNETEEDKTEIRNPPALLTRPRAELRGAHDDVEGARGGEGARVGVYSKSSTSSERDAADTEPADAGLRELIGKGELSKEEAPFARVGAPGSTR